MARRARGRPTKYMPSMCDRLVEIMSTGASKEEAAHVLGITPETFNAWRKEKPDFSEAIKKGEVAAELWWKRLGREGAAGERPIQPATWVFCMKNMFGWRDKIDVDQKVNVNISLNIGQHLESDDGDDDGAE